jgi:hypothetical protein
MVRVSEFTRVPKVLLFSYAKWRRTHAAVHDKAALDKVLAAGIKSKIAPRRDLVVGGSHAVQIQGASCIEVE